MELKTIVTFDNQRVRKLAFWVMLGSFLELMCIIGGAKPSVFSFLFLILFMGCISHAGETLMSLWGGGASSSDTAMTLVVGIAVLSIPMMFLVLMLPITSFISFIITYSCFFILFFRKRIAQPFSYRLHDLLILFILMIIIAIASYITAGSVIAMMSGHEFHAWSDNYIHGITINSFSNHLSVGRGDPNLVDTPKPFYHYAAFVLAGATMPITGLSGIATATAVLLPLGLLVALLGLYALAFELGGRFVAIISIALIVCLPEPAAYTKVGFFDFYWLLFTAPGSGYAIGVTAVTFALLNRYLNNGTRSTLFLSIGLLFSLIFIRAHFFLASAPAFFYLLVLQQFPNQRRKILFSSLMLAIAITILLSLNSWAHDLWLHYSKPMEFLSIIESPYTAKILASITPFFLKLTIQILVVLIAVLGGLLIIFPVLSLIVYLSKERQKSSLIALLPWLLIINYIGLVLFAPIAANGDLSEYKHRCFILLYPILMIFSTYLGKEIVTSKKPNISQSSSRVEYGVLLFTLVITLGWMSIRNPAEPMYDTLPWAKDFFDRKITYGVPEVVQFIKSNSEKGDVLAFNIEASKNSLNTPAIETMSLAGIPAYAARMENSVNSHIGKSIIGKRMQILGDIERQESWVQAQKIMVTHGIRWYVYFNKMYPNFDPKGDYATFHIDGITVYDSKLIIKTNFSKKTLFTKTNKNLS
ncbi:hypothetical protein [Legionella fallonii]|uniref:Glycosyltransferase RgtA/B/C/D-like domain-containing protein n=1 Tax=Legionella fallonii LLAP-10 TaxID=1212491 RepID=A0A098G7A7_9GAMM|nr:hypothetical protein [Legionella fallonii]CEG58348.1 membrane protein of unknown function [Legionella fallonii LLAP-10]